MHDRTIWLKEEHLFMVGGMPRERKSAAVRLLQAPRRVVPPTHTLWVRHG